MYHYRAIVLLTIILCLPFSSGFSQTGLTLRGGFSLGAINDVLQPGLQSENPLYLDAFCSSVSYGIGLEQRIYNRLGFTTELGMTHQYVMSSSYDSFIDPDGNSYNSAFMLTQSSEYAHLSVGLTVDLLVRERFEWSLGGVFTGFQKLERKTTLLGLIPGSFFPEVGTLSPGNLQLPSSYASGGLLTKFTFVIAEKWLTGVEASSTLANFNKDPLFGVIGNRPLLLYGVRVFGGYRF